MSSYDSTAADVSSSLHAAITTVAESSPYQTISTGYGTTWSSSAAVTTHAEFVESMVYTKLVPMVCAFGIAGNLLNLIVLSRKSLTYSMERMEKSAHCGLMALAVSDLLFCIVTLPSSHYGVFRADGGGSFIHDSFDFRLAYKLYGNAVVNMFVLTSTWLTVTMATSRYLAICHPLRARQFIGKRFSVASLATVFVVCQLFNIPRLFREEVQTIVRNDDLVINGSTASSTVVYFAYPGPLKRNRTVERIYDWSYFVFGIVVPLVILVFCNAHLTIALRRSLRMRNENSCGSTRYSYRSKIARRSSLSAPDTETSRFKSSTHRGKGEKAAMRLTLTLVIIVVMFVTLFVPAELFNFFTEHVEGCSDLGAIYNTSLAFGNLLQAINFAVNFLLYCAVNTHFRQTICRLVGCKNVHVISPGRKSFVEANASTTVFAADGARSTTIFSVTSRRRSLDVSAEKSKQLDKLAIRSTSADDIEHD